MDTGDSGGVYKGSSGSVFFYSRPEDKELPSSAAYFLHEIWEKEVFLAFSNSLSSFCAVGHITKTELFFWGWSSYTKGR